MKHDLRWMLILAWPFGIIAAWTVLNGLHRTRWFIVPCAVLIGFILLWVNVWLSPNPETTRVSIAPPKQEATVPIPPQSKENLTSKTEQPKQPQANKPTKQNKKTAKTEQPQPPSSLSKEEPPAVGLRFVYPKEPALMIRNLSDSVARDIKWMVILWNMDLPERNDPLPIPTYTFDWIKGHQDGGPLTLFSTPLVAPLLQPGNRLLGCAFVDCPACDRGRAYVVYVVLGQGGWYSALENKEFWRGAPTPPDFQKSSREKYFEALKTMAPESSMVPIAER